MSTQFTSHAVNYCNALNTQVDPRSGQFMLNFPIANLVGNHHLGPELSLSLRYSPLSSSDEGFGTGFSIGLTSFNNTTNLLQLSSGEQYKVEPGTDRIRNKKLNNFRFVYSNGRNDSEGYKVFWKEGKIEELSKTDDYQTFVTTGIVSPLGRRLTLSWEWSGQASRLSKVRDESSTLCQIVYGTNTMMTIWPGARGSYQLEFQLINTQLDVITRKVSESETLRWHFIYDQVGHPGNNLALTGVEYPTGMVDKVEYTLQEGLRFPDNSGQGARLPCVVTHIRNPGSKQPETITQYEFTTQNFLGYNGDFGDWDSNSDYLYKTLTDYTYGSTEKVVSNNVTVTTKRIYNNYHFIISEEVDRNGHIRRTETTYHAKPNVFIDGQPAQFQLPRKKIDIFQAPDGSQRKLETLTLFDESANPLSQVDSDGTVTEFDWYPASGETDKCPHEPNGFVRFIKAKRVIPPRQTGNEPEYSTKYSYALLKTNNVVQKSKSSYRGHQLLRERNWQYDDTEYKDNKRNTEFGRITLVTDKLYNSVDNSTYTSTQSFRTSVGRNDDEMIQQATVTGHDGLKTEITRCQSVFSRQVFSETSAQGIKTNYTYDGLGRLISRTLCPNTEYESTKTWEYKIDSNGPYSIEIDETGNKTKTHFDGSGRTISIRRYDPETENWFETLSCHHNALGEVGRGTVKDYLPTVSSDIYPLSSNIDYDGWGEKKEVTYSDGRTTIQKSDPITLSQTVYTQASSDTTITSGNATTVLHEKSSLPIKKILQEQTGGNIYSTNFYKWDGLGQMVEEKDELGQITKRTYDEYGRVLTLTSDDGTIVTKTYAPHMTGEQVTSISVTGVDANGDIKTWKLGTQTFDSLGRLTQRVSGGRTTSYRYQGVSPVPSSVTLPSGKIIEYTYIPELGNVVSSVYADGINQTFNYDKKTGKPLMAAEGDSILKNTWSKGSQLKEESFLYSKQIRKASHSYTLKGAPASYTDVSGKQLKYSMDKHGRVTTIDDDILSVDYKYDALGRPNKYTVRGKGSGSYVTTELNYDAFGREITRTLKDDHGLTLTVRQKWQKNNMLESRTTIKNNTTYRQETYQYDSRNRLISFTAVGNTPTDAYGNSMIGQNYKYDALNNLTSVTTLLTDGTSNQARYFYENNNDPTQLTKVTNTHPKYPANISLTYDSEGRMTRDEAGRNLTYDVMGRLINVSDEKENSSSSYGYDATNRLIKRNIKYGDSMELYYRGSELTNEINTSAHKATRLIKNNHTCLGVSDNTGLILTATDKNDSLLLSKDTNYNNESQLHAWSPYGSGQSNDKVPGFNGERFDPISGTYHLGNGYRDYNPTLMRFNCPDSLSPFGAGGINPYAYCSGDPINHTDPSGHLSWPAIIGIVAGIVGLGLAIFTAGASIAAAGGVMAAISSASATSLIIGGLGVVSDLTGIVSGALEDSNPEASSVLGWISLGTGLAGLAAAGITKLGNFTKGFDEFRPLTDAYVNESLMNVPVREVPARAIPEGMGAWHVENLGNEAKFYGSNTGIRSRNVRDAVDHLEHAGTGGKNTRILSGVHGERHGINWEKNGDIFINKTRHIDNTFFVSDRRSWHNVRLGGEGGKVKVHDIANITEAAFQEHLFSGDNIILAHCYSRNDALIRDLLQLPPVTSYALRRTRVG